MEALFRRCPSCGSNAIIFQSLEGGGAREFCQQCMFVANYVEFTCGDCNPDVFAYCPRKDCKANPLGTPKNTACNPTRTP